jgi:LPS-assembly protein
VTGALLALAFAAAPSPIASPAPPIEVLEAGHVDYEVGRERGVATGGVVLRRGAVTVRADTATYDARTGEVEARGNVLLTEPGRAVEANAMHAVLGGPYEAHDVVAFLKDGPFDLSRCRTMDEARRTGRNHFTFGGAELKGDSRERGFRVDRARVTLCDCGGAPPSWEIRAHSANVVPGDHAWLTLPVLYITPRFLFIRTPVPVMVFPVAYLPLGERQSGLLIPELALGGNNGTVISQPLFLALGRSYDATITGAYTFGEDKVVEARGVKGFGGSLELRWAPAEGSRGHARLTLLHSAVDHWPDGAARPPGMNRIAASLLHDQRISDRSYLKADVGLVDDPYYTTDFNSDALLRAIEYRRSVLALTHRRDDVLLEADVAYLLPLNNLDACPGGSCERAPFGLFGTDLRTIHRLPAVSATFLPLRLAGPLHLAGTLGVARYAPLRGPTGDEGANGIGPGERGWNINLKDAGEGDGRWQGTSSAGLGERLATTRALARAELRAPFTLGRALTVEPRVTGTAAAYAFEAALSPQADARAVAGLVLSSDLSRSFGQGAGRLRHEIQPRIEWVAGTSQAGPGLPNYAYDELDVAGALPRAVGGQTVPVRRTLTAAPGVFHQLQLSVRNRLVTPSGQLSDTSVELTLGQDLDLEAGSLSETWVQARAARPLPFGTFSSDVTARFLAFGAKRAEGTGPAVCAGQDRRCAGAPPPSRLDAFTSLQASVMVADRRGDNVHASLFAVGNGGSPRLLAGLEPFFDPRAVAADALASGSAGLAGKLSGATVTYDADFNARELAASPCGKTRAPHVYQHRASLVWDSPCKCWRAGVTAVLNECNASPKFVFVVDLSSLADRHPTF